MHIIRRLIKQHQVLVEIIKCFI